jgi:hypothetical protein
MNVEQDFLLVFQAGTDVLQQCTSFPGTDQQESLGNGEIRKALRIVQQSVEQIRPNGIQEGLLSLFHVSLSPACEV